jgi:nickel transport protein
MSDRVRIPSICIFQFPFFNSPSKLPHRFFLLLPLLGLSFCPSLAFAHKLRIFATASGAAIEGEAYAADGSPIRDTPVSVLGPKGEHFAELKTDGQGQFRYQATARVDHTLVLDAGAGHVAKYTVPADELPANLPAQASATLSSQPSLPPAPLPQADEGKLKAVPHSNDSPGAKADQLEARIEAVHAQVVQLRKQIDAYQEKLRLHDILGGLGVILGFVGLSFYFLGVRRRERMEGQK